jgi:hypothetical protein
MAKAVYALIIPLDAAGGPVDPSFGVPGWPAHPIAPGGPPPGIWPPDVGIWPGPGRPEHPIVIPPDKPGEPPLVVWPGPGYPTHPIAPGGPPPSVGHPIPPIIWPQPPDGGPPIGIDPGHPEHPIVFPPIVWPDPGHPEHPIVIPIPPTLWPKPGHPEHPIVIPPETPPEREKLVEWHTGWTETTGWIIVGVPNVNVPTPSRPPAPTPPGRK